MKVTVNPLTGQLEFHPSAKGGGANNPGGPGRQSYIKIYASDPSTGADGDLIINSTTDTIKVWYDSAWVTLHSNIGDVSGGLDNLLLVDGESFLTLQSDTTEDVLLLA